MAGYFGLPPGMRAPVAGTSLPACGLIHSIQSGHQLPWVSLAFSMNSSSDAAFPSNVQYRYFPDDGGLTTPAIWPVPVSGSESAPSAPPSSSTPRAQEPQ